MTTTATTEEMLVRPMMHHRGHDGANDIAVDADKLSYEIFSILESKFLFGYDEPNLWLPPAHPPLGSPQPHAALSTQRGKVRILTIDAGAAGMRGVLSAKALSYLEQALRTKSGDPNATIADYFDVAAGTGLGGVFAAMLFATRDGARPLYSADDTCRFLLDNARHFFRKPSSSTLLGCLLGGNGNGSANGTAAATASVERALKGVLGPGLTLRDTVKPVLIPCYDLHSGAPLVFSRADALESPGYDFRLWEVCRATWAQPGRFEPADITSTDGSTACLGIDGGLAMSNPAAAAITHVLHNKQEFPFVRGVEDVMVLSIGCGGGVPSSSSAAAATEGGSTRLRRWTAREWVQPVARIASEAAAELVDQAVALAFGHSRPSNYVRIQANGSSMGKCGPDADSDPSPGNVKMLLNAAEEMLKQKNVESVMFGGNRIGEQTNMEKLDWFAGELVLEHQRRSCRIAPTVAFKQPPPKPK